MTEKTIGGILHRIQKELKAPKGQTNSFGNYKYRSAEDILEAVKACLQDGEYINIVDDIVLVGDRYYVKATASLYHGSLSVFSTAFAREPLEKKGADQSQVTGATSSYARKYALNGLFCIDDTKDADATNEHGNEKPRVEDTEKWTPEQRSAQAEIITKIAQCTDPVDIDSILDEYAQVLAELPDTLGEMIGEQVENSRKFLKGGGKPDIKYHKFPSVGSAVQWMNKMYPVVNGFRSIKVMDQWESDNRPFINGLDCLKAETYKKNDKLPKERLLEALMTKRSELTNIQNAQTPIG